MTKAELEQMFRVRKKITALNAKVYAGLLAFRLELAQQTMVPLAEIEKGYSDSTRCKNCGIEGHSLPDCVLKKQGDKELADEARRRALRAKPLPVRPVPEVAKKKRLKLAWLTEAK